MINILKPKRLFRALTGYRDKTSLKPISCIQVELTNNCNYKCRFCPQSHWRLSEYSESPFDRSKGFMGFDLFRRVVDEANEISREINFSFFGEPMIHPEFLKFMNYLKHKDPQLGVVMNSNLSLATQEIFQKLIEIKLTDLRLSIDAATPEMYDILRPGKYYLDLDGNFKSGDRFETICRKAEFWFSLPDHRPTRHVFTVSSYNLVELKTFVQLWLPLLGDNDIILAKNVLTYGGKISDEMICANPCNVWNLNMLTVDWTGQVSPCNLDVNMGLTIGSVQESSLLELYRSRKYQQIERLSKAREIVPCKTCIDGNNWSKNIVLRKGGEWRDEYYRMYQNDVTAKPFGG